MWKKLGISALVVVVLLFGFLIWFDSTYSMDSAKSFEKGSQDADQKVLIATQGSEYKEKLVQKIVNDPRCDSSFFRVVDVSELSEIKVENWGAILVFHTWEQWTPEENAEAFLKKHYDKDKMYVLATSGSGDNMIDGIDGVSGASQLEEIETDANKIVNWLMKLKK